MSNECRCSGDRCREEVVSYSRREFLELLAAGAAGLAWAEDLAWAEGPQRTVRLEPPKPVLSNYPMTPPRVYRGKNLEAVGMPLGGIGTGSVWLDGQGRLAVWQIFNNLNENRIPDSFFAVRARRGPGEAVVRILQTEADGGLQPVASIEYEGGYPIARLQYLDPALPVNVSLEAFNPMIPLDVANSSIPCAIFRFSARNLGKTPTEVTFFATLQNAVGSQASGAIQGVKSSGYGGNRNRVVRSGEWVAVAMDKSPDPVRSGPLKVRSASGQEVDGPERVWLAGVSALTGDTAETMARVAAQGGAVLADGAGTEFFRTIDVFRSGAEERAAAAEVFEDFEKDTYEGWKLTGEAFGRRPSRGTERGQQRVSGFAGRGLVNTFIAGDAPQGTATSPPFRIERRYIGFLIGGGSHEGQTCITLRVDGKPVRSASGRNREALEPMHWDVAEFKGKEAVIEIVDRASGGWGHINIDQIVFSDIPPEPFLRRGTAAEQVARAIGMPFIGAEEVAMPAENPPLVAPPTQVAHDAGPWRIARYTRLAGFVPGDHGYRVLAATPQGDPLLIEGPLGKGRIILALAPGLPWNWGSALLASVSGRPLKEGERIVPGASDWGTMALVVLDNRARALPAWANAEQLARFVADPANSRAAEEEASSAAGETINAALGVPWTLQPGETRTATFVLTWHFPNVRRFQHEGNLYNRRWTDALDVARYVAENVEALAQRTRLYHETVYQSNLPEEFLDAMTSQAVILRGPTCFWSENGYFGGFEGSYGCCPLNCTHVWNYAQTHARLFPEVARNMRISNFITFLHPTGETSHREHAPQKAFIDGHCACIEAAYREHQLSRDEGFLKKIWPGVKKAVDWLIEAIDPDRDGIPAGHQWNTYDTAVSGANTFIGSQYLCALAAAERMALIMKDTDSAGRWRAVREAGVKNQDQKLWNGEYYVQIPEPQPARDYNTGCHADQLLGQWWAHMLGLGYLYPPQRVRAALEAVMKYNFRTSFAGFQQVPRRYVLDEEGGLLICTWPRGGRPQPFILYADEVWTGIEYAAAGAMVFEGLIDAARRIVRTARSRYDGRLRPGLNSGPGGNPYNELECGKFYARAMSSWSLLIACQGLLLDGPRGLIGFKPQWQPENHRSFFTAPEGWGLFVQQRQERQQTEHIEIRHGRLRIKELVFEAPHAAHVTASIAAAGRPIQTSIDRQDREIRLTLEEESVVPEGAAVDVTLRW